MNPNDLPMYVTNGIGALLCLLGFFALLLHRRYADPTPTTPETGEGRPPGRFRLPGGIEFDSRYPALAFVAVGAALLLAEAASPARTAPPEKIPWRVTVHVDSDVPIRDSVLAGLALSPSDTNWNVDPNTQTITITTNLAKGRAFESAFEKISLALLDRSGSLETAAAMKSFKESGQAPPPRGESGLLSATPVTREYRLALKAVPAPFERAQP